MKCIVTVYRIPHKGIYLEVTMLDDDEASRFMYDNTVLENPEDLEAQYKEAIAILECVEPGQEVEGVGMRLKSRDDTYLIYL